MNKTILIGGMTTAVVAVGLGTYLALGNLPGQDASVLLDDYRELLEEAKKMMTKDSVAAGCDDPGKVAAGIQGLETQLDLLRMRKSNILNQRNNAPPLVDPRPGSEPLELSDGNYVPPLPEFSGEQEDVPPAPELTGDDAVPPLPEFSGEPEEAVPELPPMPDGKEWIPELPPLPDEKEWIPELPPLPDEKEWIPELPPLPDEKEWIPELPPLPDEKEWIPELPPLPDEEGFIPPLPELPEGIDSSILDQINDLEKQIVSEINSLKSLCDEEGTEIISASCADACKKYSDCAGYTEGATKTDQQDAYEGCMEECAKWSDATKICINKQPIKTVDDCTNLTICALAEYSDMFRR